MVGGSTKRGARGLPPADGRVERVARIVTTIASVWYALAAAWEIAAPFGSGHVALTSARGIVAENMWTWGIIAPVREYTLDPPTPSMYYAHHPWGSFWTTSALFLVFGRHDFVCRLAPFLMSALSPPLLYAIGRAMWGPLAGALAAAGYAVLPIALAFANQNGFEVPVIFWCLVATWGYVRLHQTWQRRWLVVSVIGMLLAFNADWPSLVFGAVVLAWLFLVGLILPSRWFGGVDTRRFAQWWALSAGVAVATVLLYVYLFRKADQLDNLFSQAELRAAGNQLPLSTVLENRRYWIQLMFTPLAIFVGKLAVPFFVVRLLALRRPLEIFPLAVLAMAIFEYVYFKQGADVHIYWPQLFAPYFAMSLGVLSASFEGALRWLLARLPGRLRRVGVVPSFVAFGFWALVPLAMVRDGVRALRYGHDTGGRFNESGRIILQDVDKANMLLWLKPQLEGHTRVQLHTSMKQTWAQEWTLHRPTDETTRIPNGPLPEPTRYFIADSRFLEGKNQRTLAEHLAVRAVGSFWWADTLEAHAPISAYALQAREPSVFSRYFVAGVDPMYEVVPDPYRTWELRDAFAQTPNPPPALPARTLEQRRVRHNIAVSQGDHALADRLLAELVRDLEKSSRTRYTDGTRLLGTELRRGTVNKLAVFFANSEAKSSELDFRIVSVVEQKMTLSLVPLDDKERVVGMPFELSTTLWKPGYVYASETEIRARPGVERYYGYWYGGASAPLPDNGTARVLLLTTH
jgi:hypothetical protein